jgi:transposase
MIGPGANARVYLACGATDMRKGIDGLTALVQTALRQKPASGSVFVFRGRRGNRIKLLFWDGQGFCFTTRSWRPAAFHGRRLPRAQPG